MRKLCLLLSFYLSPLAFWEQVPQKEWNTHSFFGQDHAGIWLEPGFFALLIWTGLKLWAQSLLWTSNGMQPWGLSDGPEPSPWERLAPRPCVVSGEGQRLQLGGKRASWFNGRTRHWGSKAVCESHADSCSPALRKPKHRNKSARVLIYR